MRMEKTGAWKFAKDLAIALLGQDAMVSVSLLGAFVIYFILKKGRWTTFLKSFLTVIVAGVTLAIAYSAWKYQNSNQPITTSNSEETQDMKYLKFKVNIENIYTHMLSLMELKTLGTNIILVVSIENGGADSFAKWQPLTVITSDGRSFTGVLKSTSDDT